MAGIDNIPIEIINKECKLVNDTLATLCNQIWQTSEWFNTVPHDHPPESSNLILCQNHWTISFISLAVKVRLKLILNRLNPSVEWIPGEEQVGSKHENSTKLTLKLSCTVWKIQSAPSRNFSRIHRLQKEIFMRVSRGTVGYCE